jgi:hypothetical protein
MVSSRRLKRPAHRPFRATFVTELSHSSSTNTTDIILNALIEGRASRELATPSSLFELFIDPYSYRKSSIKGLITEIAERIYIPAAEILERGEFTETDRRLIRTYGHNLSLPENRGAILDHSIKHGKDFLRSKGIELEILETLKPTPKVTIEDNIEKPKDEKPKDELSMPSKFILELISLVQVCKKTQQRVEELKADWHVDKTRTRIIRMLIEQQAIVEMLLDKVGEWEQIKHNDEVWNDNGPYYTAQSIRNAIARGVTYFGNNIRLLKDKEYGDLSGVNFYDVKIVGADLSYANLANSNLIRSKLTSTSLEGANLTGAVISRDALNFLKAKPWRDEKDEAKRINAWCARGGIIVLDETELAVITRFVQSMTEYMPNYMKVKTRGGKYRSVDLSFLESLNQGEWAGLTLEEKKQLWIDKGGWVSEEIEKPDGNGSITFITGIIWRKRNEKK